MSNLDSFFGTALTKKDGTTVSASEALAGVEYIVCSYSASWCPPCVNFSPVLSKFHTDHSASKKFQTVLISRDRDQAGFKKYFDHVSYDYAVPPGAASDALSKKYKISGIPSVLVIDARTFQVVCAEGRQGISKDPSASKFPWKPRTVWEVLADVAAKNGSNAFVDNKGNSVTLDYLKSLSGVGFYHSAHWCPPCRKFTPELAKWYSAQCGKGGKLEGKCDIIFVSADRDEKSFKDYFGEMPWKALPFHDSTKDELDAIFKIEGIPALIFVDGEGNILTEDGRSKVMSQPDNFPWPPAPCDSLDEATSYINDTTTAVLFTDNCTDAAKAEAAESVFRGVAERYFKANGNRPNDKMRFAIAREDDDAVEQVRSFLGRSHMGDKNGPEALRITVISIPDQGKYSYKNHTFGVLDGDDLKSFLDNIIAGAAQPESLKM